MEESLALLIRRRAKDRCEYCRLHESNSPLPLEIDHIIAQKHRGPTTVGNTCLACFACNNHKGPNISGVDPLTRRIVRLFHPRLHKWPHHFRWEGPFLVGRTPIGRATIEVLAINLAHRVAVRHALIIEGVFPPA